MTEKTAQEIKDEQDAAQAAKEAAAQAKADAKAAKEAEKAQKAADAAAKKEALAKEKADKKAAAEAAKAAAKVKMPEQNGVRRPKTGGACGAAWALMDEMSSSLGQPVPAADVVKAGEAQGINSATIRTQYALWRKFHGITGRVANPAKEAEKAQKAAEKEAKAAEAKAAKEAKAAEAQAAKEAAAQAA